MSGQSARYPTRPVQLIASTFNHPPYTLHPLLSLARPSPYSLAGMSTPTSSPEMETSNQFNFTCGCLNVHIVCHTEPSTSIPSSDETPEVGSSSHYVYLGEKSEYVVSSQKWSKLRLMAETTKLRDLGSRPDPLRTTEVDDSPRERGG